MKKIIALSIILALTVTAFAGCSKKKDDETTTEEETTVAEYTTQVETTAAPVETTVATTVPETTVPVVTVPATTASPVETTTAKPDVSTYSKQQIIDVYASALNKTRSYTDNITVHHKEDMNFEVKETSVGGPLVQRFVNYIVSTFVKPSEADYNFSGGTATNEDGETIPLLLPQKNNFALNEAAVNTATIEESGDMLHVKIVLNDEQVNFGEVPQNNAGAVGYLDTSKLELKVVQLKSCTIDYTGSVIDAYIRADGYIDNVTYTINMITKAEMSGLGLSGSGSMGGAQTETWQLKW